MRHFKKILFSIVLLSLFTVLVQPVMAKDKFRIAWSIYVGWMPWDYGAKQGIVKKWAMSAAIRLIPGPYICR